MKRSQYLRLISILVSVITLSFTILFLFTNPAKYKKEPIFSENENRYLSTLPKLSFKSLQDGSATKGIQDWFSDNFAARDFFMNVRAYSERLLCKTEINDVYLCKDGFLIEKPASDDRLYKIADILSSFNSKIKGKDVSLMLVPTAISVYSDKLPKDSNSGNQIDYMNRLYELSGIKRIDVSDTLISKGKEYDGSTYENSLYYRLDHHWTSLGAYFAYDKFCKDKGIEAVPFDKLNKQKISDNFKGTVYSKLNDFSIKGETMYSYDNKDRVKVKYSDIDKDFDTLYAEEYLDKKDKYSYFLNNLHGYCLIENLDSKNDKELVIIKDSYANCFIPMLVKHYKKIHVFDTRIYKEKVSDFINKNTSCECEVLILYNLATINNDTGIGGIM